jgi:hypothetical protein
VRHEPQGLLGGCGLRGHGSYGRYQEAISATKVRKPDLALVNIRLQGRDDGIELARDLKDMGIPVLFISGQVSRARTAKSVAIGSLPKPYDPASPEPTRAAAPSSRAAQRSWRGTPLWALFRDFALFFECLKAANNRLETRHVILRDRAEQF